MDIEITVSHPTKTIDTMWLSGVVRAALAACGAAPGSHPDRQVLEDLDELSVALVDDPTIARIHEEFMAIPGATDVITFDHGEIVISLDTAARHAEEFHSTLHHEVARYAVHGLLHLNGHDDHDATGRDAMHEIQEHVLELALASVGLLEQDELS